ncbi:MAG TPA: response regulator [Spirochaetes bacterium]|nr:response regulator [Spirochaetota bacterium]
MKKILVTDDQPSCHVVLKTMIENQTKGVNKYIDCQMLSAFSGKECLEKIKEYKPDLVFMDLDMPEMSGLEAVKRIREDGQLDQLCVVALTGDVRHYGEKNFMESGFNEYMTKPFNVTEMIRYIVSVLK